MHKEKQIKVLMINTVPMDKNGITNVICNLITNSDDAVAFDCVTINKPDHYYYDLLNKKGCNIYILPSRDSSPLKYIFELAKIIRRGKYDCVHVHGNSHIMSIELLASKIAGCKVRIAHSHNTTCKYKIINLILTIPFHLLCTGCVACGNDAGKWLFGRRKFLVVNNGIDTQKFGFDDSDRQMIRERYNIQKECIVIGHVGEFNEAKNQTFLIDLLYKLNSTEFKLMLIGDGEKRSSVEKNADSRGLRGKVIFVGKSNEVEKFLSAMDVIVMPSIYEGLPLTLIEEQANGLKCIVSDNITREVDKTGLVSFLSLDDLPIWIKEIYKVQQDPHRIMSSMEAIKRIKEAGYSIENEAGKIKSIYKEALSNY